MSYKLIEKMSYIGKKKIRIPKKVDIKIEDNKILISGPLGNKSLIIDNRFTLKIDETNTYLFVINDIPLDALKSTTLKNYKSKWGASVILIKQGLLGVSRGFTKQLNLKGVGFKGILDNNVLILKLGYSHLINFNIPKNIKITCIKTRRLIISGQELNTVTQIAAKIRAYKIPEPYKGKGILYRNEIVYRKEGKKK